MCRYQLPAQIFLKFKYANFSILPNIKQSRCYFSDSPAILLSTIRWPNVIPWMSASLSEGKGESAEYSLTVVRPSVCQEMDILIVHSPHLVSRRG
jgi:hypothetical protein